MNPIGDVHNREEAHNSFTWTVRQMSKGTRGRPQCDDTLPLPTRPAAQHLVIPSNPGTNQNAYPQLSRSRLPTFTMPKVQASQAHLTQMSTPADGRVRRRSVLILHPRRAPRHPTLSFAAIASLMPAMRSSLMIVRLHGGVVSAC